MPSATTHDRIALIAAAALTVPTYVILHSGFQQDPTTAYQGTLLVIGSHLVGSWWLSPDLDIDGSIDDRWGPLRPIWLPYMKLVPHRHFVSHSGISGLFRLIYLLLMIAGLLFLISMAGMLVGARLSYHTMFFDWLWDAFQNQSSPLILLMVGVVISDIIHVAADLIDTRRKRMFRGGRRR
ncbi:MAG: DUF2227 family putative metal-binding protein [Chloroflexaceae bacterium]|nr:DUF2227 family putative metal-binding protein [Chloroflexaceae bacterium]